MKKCQQCGHENNDNMNFCIECGTKLEDVASLKPENASKVCKNCGYINEGDKNFCIECGTKLDDAGENPSKVCKVCGHENKPDMNFCGMCGAKLDVGEPVEEEVLEEPVEEPADENISQEEDKKDDNTVICEKCGRQNKSYVTFCVECGAKLGGEVSKPEVTGNEWEVVEEPVEEESVEEISSKVCSSCGFENDSDKNFCIECGTKLDAEEPIENESVEEEVLEEPVEESISKVCSSCGFENEGDVSFCAECGTKLDADEAVEEEVEEPVEEESVEESISKVCSSCGFENAGDVSFCAECGTKLDAEEEPAEEDVLEEPAEENSSKVCSSCGFENAGDVSFCAECGTKLDADGVKPQTTANQESVVIPPEQQNNNNQPSEKFLKKEQKVIKKTSKQFCPINDLFYLSSNQEEYNRTATHFKEWVSEFITEGLAKIWYFALIDHWNKFDSNCSLGLISLMVSGRYEECLECANILLDHEETVYSKGIGSYTGQGLIGGIKTFAAMTGKTGNDRQERFYLKIRLFKVAALYELNKYEEAKELLAQLPQEYYIKLVDRDDYYNKTLKHKEDFSVKHFRILVSKQ